VHGLARPGMPKTADAQAHASVGMPGHGEVSSCFPMAIDHWDGRMHWLSGLCQVDHQSQERTQGAATTSCRNDEYQTMTSH